MHRPLVPALLALCLTLPALAKEHVALLGTYTRGDSRGIYAVRLDAETGALSAPQLVAEATNPSFLALHPNGRAVYAVNESEPVAGRPGGAVAAYAVDPATGALTPLNVELTGRGGLAHLAVDGAGRMVIGASYGGGFTVAFPLAADARLEPRTTLLVHEGPLGPNQRRQDRPHPHSATLSPDNRFVFVADLGLDRVLAFRLDPSDGTLAPHDPAFLTLAPGAGPRHTKFSADGKHFYVVNELDNTVTACRYDAAAGALHPLHSVPTLPSDFTGSNTTSEIRLHPNDRFVYAANRGHNSLAVFARDPQTGELTRVEVVPTGGDIPRNFALTPDGAWLLCAHQESNDLVVFRVDPDTGRLTRTEHTATAPSAVCVLFLN